MRKFPYITPLLLHQHHTSRARARDKLEGIIARGMVLM